MNTHGVNISNNSTTDIRIGGHSMNDISEVVKFVNYLKLNHPEIRDLYIAFKAKEKVIR